MSRLVGPRYITGTVLVIWLSAIYECVPVLANGKADPLDLPYFLVTLFVSTVLIACIERIILDLKNK